MKLSVVEKIGFGAGDTAIAIVMISIHLLLTYFYTDVYGLTATDVGLLMFVVRLFDAIIDPAVGVLTDRWVTRWGRYKHYLLVFALPFSLSIYLLFLTPDVDYAYKLAWAYITYTLVSITFTFISIPYISILGVITTDEKERIGANTYRFVMTKVSMFLVSILVPTMALQIGNENLALGYQITMGAMGAFGGVLCLFCFATVQERVIYPSPEVSFKLQCKCILKNEQWMILCLVIMALMIGGVMRSSAAAYYAKYYVAGGEEMISPFLTVGVIASLLAMFASHFLIRKINKITLFRLSQITAFALGVMMFWIVDTGDIYLAFVFYFFVVFFFDMQLPIYWAAIVDAVDYGEQNQGVRTAGIAYGGILFFQKLGMGVAGGLFGLVLGYFGYQANTTPNQEVLSAINLLMSLFPAIFSLITALLMFKYKLLDSYTINEPHNMTPTTDSIKDY